MTTNTINEYKDKNKKENKIFNINFYTKHLNNFILIIKFAKTKRISLFSNVNYANNKDYANYASHKSNKNKLMRMKQTLINELETTLTNNIYNNQSIFKALCLLIYLKCDKEIDLINLNNIVNLIESFRLNFYKLFDYWILWLGIRAWRLKPYDLFKVSSNDLSNKVSNNINNSGNILTPKRLFNIRFLLTEKDLTIINSNIINRNKNILKQPYPTIIQKDLNFIKDFLSQYEFIGKKEILNELLNNNIGITNINNNENIITNINNNENIITNINNNENIITNINNSENIISNINNNENIISNINNSENNENNNSSSFSYTSNSNTSNNYSEESEAFNGDFNKFNKKLDEIKGKYFISKSGNTNNITNYNEDINITNYSEDINITNYNINNTNNKDIIIFKNIKFKKLKFLGSGATGKVFLIEPCNILDIKYLNINNINNKINFALKIIYLNNEIMRRDLINEIELMKSISNNLSNENIIKLFDYEMCENVFKLLMEAGEMDLWSFLSSKKCLFVGKTRDYNIDIFNNNRQLMFRDEEVTEGKYDFLDFNNDFNNDFINDFNRSNSERITSKELPHSYSHTSPAAVSPVSLSLSDESGIVSSITRPSRSADKASPPLISASADIKEGVDLSVSVSATDINSSVGIKPINIFDSASRSLAFPTTANNNKEDSVALSIPVNELSGIETSPSADKSYPAPIYACTDNASVSVAATNNKLSAGNLSINRLGSFSSAITGSTASNNKEDLANNNLTEKTCSCPYYWPFTPTCKSISTYGFLTLTEFRSLLKMLLNIFQQLNLNHIIHRDIKHKNFVFCNSTLKLIDFGLSRKLTPQISTHNTQEAGTHSFMSPESITKKSISKKSDIWALGNLIHEMFFGELKFKGSGGEGSLLYFLSKNDFFKYNNNSDNNNSNIEYKIDIGFCINSCPCKISIDIFEELFFSYKKEAYYNLNNKENFDSFLRPKSINNFNNKILFVDHRTGEQITYENLICLPNNSNNINNINNNNCRFHKNLTPLRSFVPYIFLIKKCLVVDPKKRFNVFELIELFNEIEERIKLLLY
ncbi:putative serine/threonine-protein kinase tsuA [Cucumispora dikerogammari]|nr:putative serine/threonine-protein kinase tsuA [Cucumispora dikerogammari]